MGPGCWRVLFGSRVADTRSRGHSAVRTKHQLNLDPNPEGTQKNLDDRRYGGREEQCIPHVGGGAGAAQGVTGYLRALGDRTGRTVTNDSAVVVPHLLEPALRPTVGDEEEKAQKLTMHPPGG